MIFDPQLAPWLFFSLLAVIILCRLMDKRRAKLVQLLQTYVEKHAQWNKKRAKAARLVQEIAHRKAMEEAELVASSQIPNPVLKHPNAP